MKIYAATDLQHEATPAGAPGDPESYLAGLHDQLLNDLSGRGCGPKRPAGVATVFPSPKYPQESRDGDKTQFERDWGDIGALSIGAPPAGGHAPGGDSPPPTSGPTLLSASQRVYDAEISRRDSINGRCSAVLNTAGILGALVVGASQLGLIRGSFDWAAWIVYPLFVISLAYLTFSIVIALAYALLIWTRRYHTLTDMAATSIALLPTLWLLWWIVPRYFGPVSAARSEAVPPLASKMPS